LTRDKSWGPVTTRGLEAVSQVAVDATWSALRFRPLAGAPAKKRAPAASAPPKELVSAVSKNAAAKKTWATLAPSHVREYATWVNEAKKPETRARRVADAVKMLAAGQRDRNAKYRA